MSKKNRAAFKRNNSGIPLHKHETPVERETRHRKAIGGPARRDDYGFDVAAWDRMHAEAEQTTLQLGPVQHGRSGRW